MHVVVVGWGYEKLRSTTRAGFWFTAREDVMYDIQYDVILGEHETIHSLVAPVESTSPCSYGSSRGRGQIMLKPSRPIAIGRVVYSSKVGT